MRAFSSLEVFTRNGGKARPEGRQGGYSMSAEIGAVKFGAGKLCKAYANYKRVEAKQESLACQAKASPWQRREKIAQLEHERTRLEFELENTMLEMLCIMGLVDEDWQAALARTQPLQAAITGFLDS